MGAVRVTFPVDHPCGAGHFPGNPIIPGALLLSTVLDAIAAQLQHTGSWQVTQAKFPQSVRPGATVAIDYRQTAAGDIVFWASVDGQPVLAGSARVVAGAPV